VERPEAAEQPTAALPLSTPVRPPEPRLPARQVAAPGATPDAPTPTRPPVVIERIEIVTPPAKPAPADPLASLAERRVGRSRHGAAR
jgi:hypothetical protein